MRRIFSSLGMALLCCRPFAVLAEDVPRSSLFFSNDELKQISANVLAAGEHSLHRDDIHLGAIMYYGPQDWMVWLQGQRWSPRTKATNIQIVEVKPDHVQLHYAGIAQDITLKPYQTYQLASGRIIEGR